MEEMKLFLEMGKVPDILKMLPEYDGNPKGLNTWLDDVEGIFHFYAPFANCPTQMGIIMRIVRRKIVGEASDILNANHVGFDWESTKETLKKHFRDQRNLKTLDYDLTVIRQKYGESIEQYYNRTNELLSLIIAYIKNSEKYVELGNGFVDYFKEKAVDSFIRGLNNELGILVKTAAPDSLNKAYQLCLEFQKMQKGTQNHGQNRFQKPNYSVKAEESRNYHYQTQSQRGTRSSVPMMVDHSIRSKPTHAPKKSTQVNAYQDNEAQCSANFFGMSTNTETPHS